MQSTLLGLAIAAIVALVTALVAPYFVDWSSHRGTFEREASRLVGLPVKVGGAIDVRLLPTPSIRLRDIEIDRPSGGKAIEAKALGLELNLGDLVRGQIRADEVHLVGPEFQLGLDRNGAVEWALPAMSAGNGFSIDRLNIEDGRAILTDAASRTRLVLERFWFNGEVRSLLGPVKGEGAFVMGDALYGYRIASGKYENGALKLKIGVDSSDRPLSVDGDGTVTFADGAPQFEGALTLARPVGTAAVEGRTEVTDPWQLTAKVEAKPASALFKDIAFQYGPQERAIKLTGTAEFRFGASPKLTGVLSGRQLDLDRALATEDAPQRLPLAELRRLADLFTGTMRPPVPVAVGVGIDTVTLGGASVHAVRGDLAYDGRHWSLDQVELRAPGYTQIRFSGQLQDGRSGLGFTGPVAVDATDPQALLGWLEGRSRKDTGPLRALRAKGDVTLTPERIAVARLTAALDKETLTGHFAYRRGTADRPARLDAALHAAELDVDSLVAFGTAVLDGTSLERPREVQLTVDVGRAVVGGLAAKQVDARVKFDAAGLQVERLAVADFAGTRFDASGRIDTGATVPHGVMTFDLDAQQTDGLLTILQSVAPAAVPAVRRLGARLAPAKLHATLAVTGASDPQQPSLVHTKLTVDGTLGPTAVTFVGAASGLSSKPQAARVALDLQLNAERGAKLLQLLGLDHTVAVAEGAGRLSLSANGPLDGALKVASRLTAGGLDASASGTATAAGEGGPRAELALAVAQADLSPLRPAGVAAQPLPASLTARLLLKPAHVALQDAVAHVADATVRGQLALATGDEMTISGKVDIDTLDAAGAFATAVGLPLAPQELWSSEPFGDGLIGAAAGRVELNAGRAVVSRDLVARNLHAVLRLSRSDLVIDNVAADLGNGRLAGALTVGRGVAGLAARLRLALQDVDLAALTPLNDPGKINLRLEAEGSGLSPKALVGSMAGSGHLALARLRIAQVDPGVFAEVKQATAHGARIEPDRVRNLVETAFARGDLSVAGLEGPLTVSSGRVRLANAHTQVGGDVDVQVGGSLGLVTGQADGRLTLSGPGGAYAALAGQPEIALDFKGPLFAPTRRLDVSALVGWLTLRAVEEQARRLDAVQASRRASPAQDKPPAHPEARRVRHAEPGVLSETPLARPSATARGGLDRLRPEVPQPRPASAAPVSDARLDPPTASTRPAAPRSAPPLPAPLDIGPPPGVERRSAPAPRRRSLLDMLIRP